MGYSPSYIWNIPWALLYNNINYYIYIWYILGYYGILWDEIPFVRPAHPSSIN
jgi:hypothetical protein